MAEFDIRSIRGKTPGDRYSDEIDMLGTDPDAKPVNPLDGEAARKDHKWLLSMYFHERDKQSANRLEMAIDADAYDGIQWDQADAEIVKSRGQMPLVYNETAPVIDWLIGTERRTKVDWRVLPRTEDDVDSADVKTKALKYVSDVNHVPFARSRAFADAMKAGVGWVDDGARDDPTQDILYSKYEDWRNVLWDSASYEMDLSDARYIFRWRWVDEDVALMMFPERKEQILRAIENAAIFDEDENDDLWYSGEKLEPTGRTMGYGSASMVDTKRRRIKLIEAQYRKPTEVKIVTSGPLKGSFFGENDLSMKTALEEQNADIIDKVAMRVHVAVFTETDMLSCGVSVYRHNRFSLTPIWCYRYGRNRLPYGPARRFRDIQQDLNKRASKALFLLNTNQVIADEGAVDDWNNLRDEVDRPDGMIIKKAGKELTIRRDTDAATGQIQMMTLAAQSIQKTAGVNNENLGRQTNAISGAAIEARQNQGSVGTTEPFDNLRLAIQTQGEKQLSLAEQFYTEEKVIRLTGAKGQLDWVRINQPEVQADGSVRYLNDITNSMADFVVSEQDYAGTMRQVMFESLNNIVLKMPPDVGLRIFTIAMEFSDLPNKDLIADAIRQITGERDPSKKLTPEEEQAQAEQTAQQTEALAMQRESAMNALEEGRARVREMNAKAAKLEQEAGAGGMPEGAQGAITQVQSQAADQIDALAEELRKSQAELASKSQAIGKDADTQVELARIDADAKVRVAEIQAESNSKIAMLEKRLEEISAGLTKNNNAG